MDKKYFMGLGAILILLLLTWSINWELKDKEKKEEITKDQISTTVMSVNKNSLTVQDANNIIYTFETPNPNVKSGDNIIIEYTGILNKSIELQKDTTITELTIANENKGFPENWQDNGLFHDFYNAAYKKLQTMTLDEKIAQILLVRYPENAETIQKKYQFGGYVFFQKDFQDKTKEEVKKMIQSVESVSKIPLLTAVDEEGGKVIRVSSNPKLVDNPFKSSKELYKNGGLNAIKTDTINKSRILSNLGLNLNLAPVVDVTTDPNAYMYERTLGENTKKTSEYAETVIETSHGTKVSYTLKHFPGYGNNSDTHQGIATDTRVLEDLKQNDLPPFEAGIKKGAEAILMSHNIILNVDSTNPSSLSPSIHNLLRNDLNFTGIIITDDLAMSALNNISNPTTKAILAGNDLIITTDYESSMNEIKKSLSDGVLDESTIDKLAFRILAWKYYKGLMYENEK
ncbi:MAG: beta-hexosaminidase [Bacilli bacterium]|nr:beta-hexosaminidase [Bacilli bacterium]